MGVLPASGAQSWPLAPPLPPPSGQCQQPCPGPRAPRPPPPPPPSSLAPCPSPARAARPLQKTLLEVFAPDQLPSFLGGTLDYDTARREWAHKLDLAMQHAKAHSPAKVGRAGRGRAQHHARAAGRAAALEPAGECRGLWLRFTGTLAKFCTSQGSAAAAAGPGGLSGVRLSPGSAPCWPAGHKWRQPNRVGCAALHAASAHQPRQRQLAPRGAGWPLQVGCCRRRSCSPMP
jgi:hypothetical protein